MARPAIDAHTMALITMAVREDLGTGDRTVALAIPEEMRAEGTIVARRAGVICGTYLLGRILGEYPGRAACTVAAADGVSVAAGQTVATLHGAARTLLSAERVLLNFLCHLSGVATLTRRYVDAVTAAGAKSVICDTRKTTPGWRELEKYAVFCGGGVKHRMGLYDGVMLKDNHLAALRQRLGHGLSLAELTRHVRATLDADIKLWLEVDTLEQLSEALPGAADIILLDNFTVEQMREAVRLRDAFQSKIENRKSQILLEASGGVTLETVADIARTGVDRISVGALTHSAPALDLSMEFQ